MSEEMIKRIVVLETELRFTSTALENANAACEAAAKRIEELTSELASQAASYQKTLRDEYGKREALETELSDLQLALAHERAKVFDLEQAQAINVGEL